MIRRTITFPQKELLDELERLQECFDTYEARVQELEQEVERLRNNELICIYPGCAQEASDAEARLAIAVEALNKIQNCEIEIRDGEVIYYLPRDAVDLAVLMASRALDEIGGKL
jgi:cell division protein FtsB